MTQKTIKATDIVAQIEALKELVEQQSKTIADLQSKKPQQKKRTVEEAKDLLPYGDKINVLKNLDIEYLKGFMSKNDFKNLDKFPLTKGEFIKVFKDHKLGGNAWITYSEQIDYFITPLKTYYKISKKDWDGYKKKLVTKLKTNKKSYLDTIKSGQKNNRELTEGQKKSLQYKANSVSATINKLESL